MVSLVPHSILPTCHTSYKDLGCSMTVIEYSHIANHEISLAGSQGSTSLLDRVTWKTVVPVKKEKVWSPGEFYRSRTCRIWPHLFHILSLMKPWVHERAKYVPSRLITIAIQHCNGLPILRRLTRHTLPCFA